MFFITDAHAQEAVSSQTSSLIQFAPFILMFVVLYFLMIRPQMKRQKEHRAMIDAVTKGDEVATSGGLVGRVVNIDEQFLQVELTQGVVVQLQRGAVVQVLPKGTLK